MSAGGLGTDITYGELPADGIVAFIILGSSSEPDQGNDEQLNWSIDSNTVRRRLR